MRTPPTRYAQTVDGVTIAYQTLGDGPIDVVLLRAWFTNVEHDWEEPVLAHVFRRFAAFGRLILFDRRGSGLSDPVDGAPTLDARVDDLTAVLDAVSSESVVLVGLAEAATAFCAFYAAGHPARVGSMVLYDPCACGRWELDYPWGSSPEEIAADLESLSGTWGRTETAEKALAMIAVSRADDEGLAEWLATSQRRSASPRSAQALYAMAVRTDVRAVLPSISTRTLVIHRGGPETPPAESAWIAAHIPGARLLRLPGPDHMLISGDTDSVVDEMERFITGAVRTAPVLDRELATILFTDIVSSTEELARQGDRGWVETIGRHHAAVRQQLREFRGRELDTAGDGFFAAFDGPARAVRCAQQIIAETARLGLQLRAGVHTGECETADGKLVGLAVVVGARVMGRAGPGQVLTTATVRDLTAGSGVLFEDAGEFDLKGVPGRWPLFSAVSAP